MDLEEEVIEVAVMEEEAEAMDEVEVVVEEEEVEATIEAEIRYLYSSSSYSLDNIVRSI
jgi:hypothetical protein